MYDRRAQFLILIFRFWMKRRMNWFYNDVCGFFFVIINLADILSLEFRNYVV